MEDAIKNLLIALAIAVAVTAGASKANAGYSQYIFHEDGTMTEYVINDKNEIIEIWLYDEDGNIRAGGFYDNPNPDDPSSGMKGDYDSAMALAKQNAWMKGVLGEEIDFNQTPLGKHRTGKGQGLLPVHDPSDGYSPGSNAPPDRAEPPAFDWGGGVAGGGWFDPNGGSPAEQLKKPGNKGGNDDDNDNDPTNGDGFFGDLPGPPELVNPAPEPYRRSPAAGPLMARHLQSLAAMSRPRAAAPRPMATPALRSAATARFAR
jgi:hypothetical protein